MTMELKQRGKMKEEDHLCPFCREPPYCSDKEVIEQYKKLMEKGNAYAFNMLGLCYAAGSDGMPQDEAKANELCLKAGELGCADGYANLGISYNIGRGVELDKMKAKHFYELAAMSGNVSVRYNLGCKEGKAGNHQRAFNHFMLSARAGYSKCLENVKTGFMAGIVTKDEYESTLRACHESQMEMKSEARDKAAAFLAEIGATSRSGT